MLYVLGMYVLATIRVEIIHLVKEKKLRELLTVTFLLAAGVLYGTGVILNSAPVPGLLNLYQAFLPAAQTFASFFALKSF